ncbi:MAG: HAMP domain-containing protein [Chloroflexi bacterium]|nr:HAMP domain-containing protein [Chloroflexota bacterium]
MDTTLSDRPSHKPSLMLRSAGGVALAVLVSLGIFYLLMSPPVNEIGLMALFLTITAMISVAAGYGAYRLGWISRSPRIRLTVLGGYALSSLLTFFNVWLTARLMFASLHDLLLATVLLVFAGGIAISLGYFLSEALTDRIVVLNQAANSVAEGDLATRVPVTGSDELADLARTFNTMAAQIETAIKKQEELDTLRRDLIAWVGHDLRTPLASIRAMVEALADGMVDDADTVKRYLTTMQRDIRSLSLLIDDLFQMAQIDAGGLQLSRHPGSLSDLISDTIESFSELAARQGVTLEGSAAPGVDPILIDTRRIGQVVANLVSNALRHTPAGGKVQVRASKSSAGVLVEIQDTGEGIRAEDLPFIFQQFYRGEKSRSRATGGAGLGLAIAKGIVEAHGGQIGVESATEQGARFFFTLPREV